MKRRGGAALGAVVAPLVLALPVGASAETTVSLISDDGEWVGGGGQ
jgi:hypothetical protein